MGLKRYISRDDRKLTYLEDARQRIHGALKTQNSNARLRMGTKQQDKLFRDPVNVNYYIE